jgi:hypothetical protein
LGIDRCRVEARLGARFGPADTGWLGVGALPTIRSKPERRTTSTKLCERDSSKRREPCCRWSEAPDGIEFDQGIADMFYGARQFSIRDPNGYIVYFIQTTEP